ncbi:Uncharacterised protein [Staphylococcus aureus]|nr:Uncharacterised protein [Staphylococcus aureus]
MAAAAVFSFQLSALINFLCSIASAKTVPKPPLMFITPRIMITKAPPNKMTP